MQTAMELARRSRTRGLVGLAAIAFGMPAAAVGCDNCGNSSPTHAIGDAGTPTGTGASDATPEATTLDAGTAADATGANDGGVVEASSDAGADGPTACALGDGASGISCGGSCVNPSTDPGNCGACSTVCEAGALCSSGLCQNVAGNLEGLRWQLPCTGPYSTNVCLTEVDGSDQQVLSTTLSGLSEETYLVTLLFRGVVEQKSYDADDAGNAIAEGPDGGSNPQFFVTGGAPAGDGYNIYELQISDPPQTYFLNAGSSNITNTWPLDYEASIPMNAGATVTLSANAIDNEEITNNSAVDGGPILVPGVPPYPLAYDGQFIQMDIVSVTPAN